MRQLAVIFALVGLAAPAGLAQSTKTIKFRAICFQHEKDIKEVLAPAPGEEGGMQKVPLFTSVFSDPMQMKTKNGTAVFYVENPDSTSDKDKFTPVAAAKVPAASPILFVFLPPKKGSKMPYRLLALPDDLRSAPWRSVRLLNIAPVSARFNLGEFSGKRAIQLEPGKMKTVPQVRKLNQYNAYNVVIEFKGKNGYVGVSNTRWKSVDGKRDLAIAYYDPKRHRPIVNLYSDVKPADIP